MSDSFFVNADGLDSAAGGFGDKAAEIERLSSVIRAAVEPGRVDHAAGDDKAGREFSENHLSAVTPIFTGIAAWSQAVQGIEEAVRQMASEFREADENANRVSKNFHDRLNEVGDEVSKGLSNGGGNQQPEQTGKPKHHFEGNNSHNEPGQLPSTLMPEFRHDDGKQDNGKQDNRNQDSGNQDSGNQGGNPPSAFDRTVVNQRIDGQQPTHFVKSERPGNSTEEERIYRDQAPVLPDSVPLSPAVRSAPGPDSVPLSPAVRSAPGPDSVPLSPAERSAPGQ
ncbi:hypothetical protein [Amycolatopsis panacis]|uniref:Uncharacterized protein n=1 Tax=Amycolatopsis panacis TaxID=2340917 RepID=A0A419I518_9PSEU|nr:hypothetical protein [Amycolatopsis panacis]RJQ85773.1 hypothetical protein D5S19_12700 [Amycolatopsis panacis]